MKLTSRAARRQREVIEKVVRVRRYCTARIVCSEPEREYSRVRGCLCIRCGALVIRDVEGRG